MITMTTKFVGVFRRHDQAPKHQAKLPASTAVKMDHRAAEIIRLQGPQKL